MRLLLGYGACCFGHEGLAQLDERIEAARAVWTRRWVLHGEHGCVLLGLGQCCMGLRPHSSGASTQPEGAQLAQQPD